MSITLANPNELRDELDRRGTNRERVLEALRQAGATGCTNVELVAVGGMRAVGARLPELRDAGHDIETVCEGRGRWRFVLHEPARLKPGTPGYLASLPVVASIQRHAMPVRDDEAPADGCLFPL